MPESCYEDPFRAMFFNMFTEYHSDTTPNIMKDNKTKCQCALVYILFEDMIYEFNIIYLTIFNSILDRTPYVMCTKNIQYIHHHPPDCWMAGHLP